MTERPIIVVGIGGNAIIQEGQRGTIEEQFVNITKTCDPILDLVEEGYQVVMTHGNGPQVGNLLFRAEAVAGELPVDPLDVCVAQTQGMLGYMIQQVLRNRIRLRGLKTKVATIITQVVVDADDPAFQNPTKPVGPFFSKERANTLSRERGHVFVEDAGRGHRRVVPSPKPVDVVEKTAIRLLVQNEVLTIAVGGGGIPVIRDGKEQLQGMAAVIDKDLAAGILAKQIKADYFIVLTGVEKVALNFGTPLQVELDEITVSQAKEYLQQGHFPAGSMGPKIEAAVSFVEDGGSRAVITHIDKLKEAFEGKTGTCIIPDTA